MNSFNCHISMYIDGKLVKSKDNLCWRIINDEAGFTGKFTGKYGYCLGKYIYISQYDQPETRSYQNLLIGVINEITPCEKIMINKTDYIKIKLLERYDNSLILLNFIRNLWFDPIPGYCNKFFENLSKTDLFDPMLKLTWANKEACANKKYSPGHSNYHHKNDLIMRSVKDLMEYTGSSTREFLTGKKQ